MDVVDAATRSRMMAGIKGSDTRPEMIVRRGLHAAGYRFVLHDRRLPGRPDLVLPKWQAVIFVNGCFWHWHQGCPYFRLPGTRPEFWREKLGDNAKRDESNLERLSDLGWRTAVVWECALRQDPDKVMRSLAEWVRAGEQTFETRSITDQ